MAFGPYPGLGATKPDAPPDLTVFRTAAAAPAPPITGKAYVWPHPSGLFNVQIGADGAVGGFVSGPINDPSASDLTRATAQVVSAVWAYPFIHGSGIAAPVTGNEMPDATLQSVVQSFFAFNKGMVATPTGWQGQNVIQTGAIQQVPTTVQTNQPNVAAKYQQAVTDATNAANGLVNRVPLSTQLLAAAVAQLNISGPGVPALVSSVTAELEQQRQAAIQQLQALVAQWAATWAADVKNIASDPAGATITHDLNAGNDAITGAVTAATKQLQGAALTLLQQAGGQQAASQQGAASGTTQTTSAQGGPTEATTTPAGGTATGPTSTGPATGPTTPAAAGFSGTAALVLGLGVVGAILASRKGKR